MSPGLSLRARWTLSIAVAVVLLVALVVYVNGHNTDAPLGQAISPGAAARANQQAAILAAQDQAPHVSRAAPGARPAGALRAAVAAAMRSQIAGGGTAGPLQQTRCAPAGVTGSRVGFSCRALAASVYYDFAGVLDRATGRVTLCRRDVAVYPEPAVPVSPRCRA